MTNFCLWLKNELSPTVAKVSLSKRLKDTPAIVVGQMSSSMRMMMQMMQQSGGPDQQSPDQSFNNQTLEINPAHPIIVNLNHLRKTNATLASLVSKQMLDNILLSSGIPFDTSKATSRTYSLLEKILDSHLDSTEVRAERKLKSESTSHT